MEKREKHIAFLWSIALFLVFLLISSSPDSDSPSSPEDSVLNYSYTDIAIVQESVSGDQTFKRYNSSPPRTANMGMVSRTTNLGTLDNEDLLTSYKWVGNAGENSNIIAIVTGNFDADDQDEIGFVRKNKTNGNQRLILYDAPRIVEDSLPNPFASYTWIGNVYKDSNVIQAIADDFDLDGKDEIGFVRLDSDTGKGDQRLQIYEAPLVDGESFSNSPIVSYSWIGNI